MGRFSLAYFLLLGFGAIAQHPDTPVLKFSEFIGYVKQYHPIAKQAELGIDAAQANLMRSRGGFDPKIEVDYGRKAFKGTEYYDRLNATFKVPVWYGVDLKGNFEQNDGEFLNPSEITPTDGLYSAGVSVSLGEGLWMNERMATLKQAKLFNDQTLADRDIRVNQVLFDASLAYFEWLKAYLDLRVFSDFLGNAQIRFEGVKTSADAGEVAAIDTVEAKIAVQDRKLQLEQAKLDLMRTGLELSNFLWMGDNIPMELQASTLPDTTLIDEIDITLKIEGNTLDTFTIANHPKLKSLRFKLNGLEVDKQFKTNKLLPKINVEYNFLTETPEYINSFETQAYKGKITFSMPLFLRKERGDLKLAKIKIRDAEFEFDNTEIQIKNSIEQLFNELEGLKVQTALIEEIVGNYDILLAAEERKFRFGESSLFLVNAREIKLIDAQLKRNRMQNKYFTSKAKLFKSLAINPMN
ncbi:Outer membrane protein TolC [Pricia antarctica]|uniref:Outer membrane protein TolC n=2 Tax=Pricia antarctica TaxID=641691 RepID=A0A1G7DFS7_9FLAO|nr:Outer membrane protein TolC [Pricia antarctica]